MLNEHRLYLNICYYWATLYNFFVLSAFSTINHHDYMDAYILTIIFVIFLIIKFINDVIIHLKTKCCQLQPYIFIISTGAIFITHMGFLIINIIQNISTYSLFFQIMYYCVNTLILIFLVIGNIIYGCKMRMFFILDEFDEIYKIIDKYSYIVVLKF